MTEELLNAIVKLQDEHTVRLERLETRLDVIAKDLAGLRKELPDIVGDAVRDALRD